jgi:hypothetical protein
MINPSRTFGFKPFLLLFKVPIVYLCGNVSWLASRFLLEKFPQFARLLDKKALQAVEQQRITYLQNKESSLTK